MHFISAGDQQEIKSAGDQIIPPPPTVNTCINANIDCCVVVGDWGWTERESWEVGDSSGDRWCEFVDSKQILEPGNIVFFI